MTPPVFHNCRCDREFVTQFDIEDKTYEPTPEDQLPPFPADHF